MLNWNDNPSWHGSYLTLVCNISQDCLKEMERYAKAGFLNGRKNKDTKHRMFALRSYVKIRTKKKKTRTKPQKPL